jgi:extracellular factor (EF) 3-hydroxypalmitic acid methyl ester biosynthesis protein
MGTQNATPDGNIKFSLVMGQTGQGADLHGTLVRLDHHAAIFELYSPNVALRVSEVLSTFKITVQEKVIYSGRAVIRSLVNTGSILVCEAALSETSWMDVATFPSNGNGKQALTAGFEEFIRDWQKVYRVSSDYKIVVADIQTFLADLRLWINQVELGIRSLPAADRIKVEMDIAQQLRGSVTSALTSMFERFEMITGGVEEERQAAHRAFGQRQLHQYLLCAPFIYRTYAKPLGYAGDYEMMNMIVRNTFEGPSLYAKLVNSYLLDQAPAHAVRNRVAFLKEKIIQETSRMARSGGVARIFNIACGPAWEVQNFLAEQPSLAERAQFDLLDFNDETLQHTTQQLEQVKRQHSRNTPIKIFKKSVHHMLREKERRPQGEATFDLIYCSGLYDYLSDRVCKSLNTYFYEQLSPGGLLVVGNFDPSTPIQSFMGHFLEWFLIYRSPDHLARLAPDQAPADACKVIGEPTGTNIFLEVRKPK